jgi:hypothetical protein
MGTLRMQPNDGQRWHIAEDSIDDKEGPIWTTLHTMSKGQPFGKAVKYHLVICSSLITISKAWSLFANVINWQICYKPVNL